MHVVIITPPKPLADLKRLKAHLGVLHDDDDALLTGYLEAVSGHIDGPDGWLGRAVGDQVLELVGPAFPCAPFIALPLLGARELVSVTYLAPTGEEVVMPDGSARLVDNRIVAASGTWPSTMNDPEAVRVRWKAGFVAVPKAIETAVLIMAAALNDGREGGEDLISGPVAALLSAYRKWRV